jgi:putative peptide zinc metalloprotease protein
VLSTTAPWPALREELRLHEGPADAAGQPTWTLQDPVRHRFLRIDWLTWEVLRHWWLGDARRIAEHIGQHTTLAVSEQDVTEVLALARREELVHPVAPPETPATGSRAARGLQWLLHNYLFFRVPLWRPDRALARLLPLLRWLGHPAFAGVSAFAALAGLFGVLQQTERLQAQWLDLLSWRGLLLYGLTLCAVKVAHELGHALVARHHGCRVPTMGVAFMVMWPVAYTDTTEAWRLADGRARMRIAAAGVRTELTIAAWATLAWSLLPDGPLRTAAFVLATMTWVSSLLINLSPFLRFDGYFLLCDALELPNLHERSFAQARVGLRRGLLGWRQAWPEDFAAGARRALIGFAFATWAWRLVLYLGIAWTVYHVGFKLLGLALLVVELGWFIAWPVARELGVWREGWPQWRAQRRWRFTLVALLLAGAAAFVPWRSSVPAAALVQPAQTLAVRLPAAATLVSVDVAPGQRVKAGQVLLRAGTPELARQAAAVQAQVERLQQELNAAALGGEQQGRWASIQGELATARGQAEALRAEQARLQVTAPFDGQVVDMLPGLAPGSSAPPASQVLMHLAAEGAWGAVAYVDELTARGLRVGQGARVVLDARPWQGWPARVQSVAAQPSALVAEPTLVQANGGQIDAREAAGGWVPAQSLYRVTLQLDEPLPLRARSWRGHAAFGGEPQSLAERLWRPFHAAWVREAGF